LYSLDNPDAVSLKEYKNICYSFNKELARLIVENGIMYKLPYRLGSIGIKRRKAKFSKLKPDWNYWKQTGELTFHLNEHSKGWYGFGHWKKKDCKVKGKWYYKFNFTRDINRAYSKVFQEPNGYQRYEIAPNKIKKNKT
jgi:hypothetical protein